MIKLRDVHKSAATFFAFVLITNAALADIIITATERENKLIVSVNLTTNVVTPIHPTPDLPDSLVLDTQGALIYSQPVANEVRRFDPVANTDSVLANSTNGISFPQDMTLDPTGTILYVANFLGNSITKINLTAPFPNGTACATSYPHPEGMTFDSGGRMYLLAGFDTASAGIFRIDPITCATLQSNIGFDPANEPDAVTFDPSTNRLFVTSSGIGGSNAVFSIDPTTLAAVKIATVPQPDGIINDSHGTLYVASRTGFVYSVNESTFTVTKLTPVPTIDDLGVTLAQPPTAVKTFTPSTVFPGGTSLLQITITNPNPATNLSGISFTDTLPPGIIIAAAPPPTNTCGGILTAVAGGTSLSLSGGSIPGATPSASCTIQVTVVDLNPPSSTSTNCVTVSSQNGGPASQTCATISVSQLFPLAATKTFAPTTIAVNGTTLMTITITNPAVNPVALGVNFNDPLPSGLIVSTPNNLANTCGGVATATPGSSAVSLVGGSLAAGASCTIALNVSGTAVGVHTNTVVANSSNVPSSPPASASVTVQGPPAIAKTFTDTSIPVFSNTTLNFLVTNPNPAQTLTGLTFTDILPVGLVVATPNGLTGSCDGGTITAFPGTNSISLSGATLGPLAECSFSVDVTAIVAGVQVNTTSNITASGGLVGNSATATLNINPPGDAYQIDYLPNVKVGGFVNITNAGSLGADAFGPRSGTSGRICANIYAFSPDEQEISCCSCLVTPNALVHITAADLIGNTATGIAPDSVVVKVLFTVPGATGTTPGTQAGPFNQSACNAAFPFGLGNLAPGGRAWTTKLHSQASPPAAPFSLTETPMIANPIALGTITQNTVGEITMLTNLCQFIAGNQSGAGICKSCSLGGIGANKQ